MRGSGGLILRGTPPYPWWQWMLLGVVWGGVTFLIFGALTALKDVGLMVAIWAAGGALFTLWTRQRIMARERRNRGSRDSAAAVPGPALGSP